MKDEKSPLQFFFIPHPSALIPSHDAVEPVWSGVRDHSFMYAGCERGSN